MNDDLTLSDIAGDATLEAKLPDKEGLDDLRLTIKQDGRPELQQSIYLHQGAEEDLATFLLKDLVDEESASIALTPEDHRVLADLGIAKRPDGKWGFRLKCANRACQEVPPVCYCADGLLEAVREASTRRSSHMCSLLCWFADGVGLDYLHDYPDIDPESWVEDAIGMEGVDLWMQLHTGADRDAVADSKDVWDALKALSYNWRHDYEDVGELRDEVDQALHEAFSELKDDGAIDYEPDSHECACPTGGGSA